MLRKVSLSDRKLIKAAAAMAGVSMTQFIIAASVQAAQSATAPGTTRAPAVA
jgi:uncharacterized protein (DUF1778 family)